MTNKKYADMTTIMQFCRIFSEQMYKCMKNAGLINEGFKLRIKVGRTDFGEDDIETSYIWLEKDILTSSSDEWANTRMYQTKLAGTEWKVSADPIAETGSLPPEIYFSKDSGQTDGKTACGKATGKPYPPYDLWISACDDPVNVGGGQ